MTPINRLSSSAGLSEASHTPSNLRKEIKMQMEDSVEFQILRKNFSEYINLEISEESDEEVVYQKPTPQAAPANEIASAEVSATLKTEETMQFSVSVEGQNITINVETLQWSRLEISRREAIQANQPGKKSDPLVLDLNNDGIKTSGLAQGVNFDLDANGSVERISRPLGDDALLALDKNHNSIIDDGTELFGDQTGFANGFDALAHYDENHDYKINQADSIFADLMLMRWNDDGKAELRPLSEAVSEIDLHYLNRRSMLENTDEITQTSSAKSASGKQIAVYDLLLNQSE